MVEAVGRQDRDLSGHGPGKLSVRLRAGSIWVVIRMMCAVDRWEWLEGVRRESAISVAVKQLAGLVADEVLRWPPRVALAEGHFQNRFGEILAPGAARPSRRAFEEALRCARWEIARDFAAIDFYERNGQRGKACSSRRDLLASEFIEQYILEAFFVLMEKTDSRVKRKDVLVGIDWVERRINVAWDAN